MGTCESVRKLPCKLNLLVLSILDTEAAAETAMLFALMTTAVLPACCNFCPSLERDREGRGKQTAVVKRLRRRWGRGVAGGDGVLPWSTGDRGEAGDGTGSQTIKRCRRSGRTDCWLEA